MLTEQGINYLSTQEGGKRMNYKEEQSKKKEILTELYENGVLEFARFNNISWEDYVSIVEGCQIDGYISVEYKKMLTLLKRILQYLDVNILDYL